jgi:hypothetical protein
MEFDYLIKAINSPKSCKIWKVSNPIISQKNAYKYLGDDAILYLSNRKDKKYAIWDENENMMIHFGDLNYKDFTRHRDPIRRQLYLNRSCNIKGNWRNNKYSKNNLSINILWS